MEPMIITSLRQWMCTAFPSHRRLRHLLSSLWAPWIFITKQGELLNDVCLLFFFYASFSSQYFKPFHWCPHLFYFRKELSKTDTDQFLQVLVLNYVASSEIGPYFLLLESKQGLCKKPILLDTSNQQL